MADWSKHQLDFDTVSGQAFYGIRARISDDAVAGASGKSRGMSPGHVISWNSVQEDADGVIRVAEYTTTTLGTWGIAGVGGEQSVSGELGFVICAGQITSVYVTGTVARNDLLKVKEVSGNAGVAAKATNADLGKGVVFAIACTSHSGDASGIRAYVPGWRM